MNDPRAVVRELLEGQADLHPGQALLETENVIVRADLPPSAQRQVALISGGGSGHEPAHTGYVGAGMLHAAVAGDVFTSPSVDAVLSAIRAVAGPAGAILIVKNYTGDRLNFGLAAELASAEGIPTDVVVVADDVALRDTVEPARRRGIAGTVLIHKIAGAASAAGLSRAEVKHIAEAAAGALGSMGVSLGACTVPAVGTPGFTLGEDEIELGLGIHGERGVERTKALPADAIVDRLVTTLVEDRRLSAGARIALLVNNLGGTPPMELAIVARRALSELRRRGITVERAFAGTYMTALEMPGCSLSVLSLDDARLALLDAPTLAPAWVGDGRVPATRQMRPVPASAETIGDFPKVAGAGRIRDFVAAAAQALLAAEDHLTALDSAAGDGDLGISMRRGAEALLALPDSTWVSAPAALCEIGGTLRRAIAGSSGPFYATALIRAARTLPRATAPTQGDWAKAFRAGLDAIKELGGATAGDRTMIDALQPAVDTFEARVAEGPTMALGAAAMAAKQGADATAAMSPRLGRAQYLGHRAVGTVDGGAAAVAIWLGALASASRS
ncbi:MAG TPA: dihydroxyacetone kinase family protein [Aliidongia sp.]|uniref:dihydroxyacetone kinase family protein n=1 Tax=Aliidongia sp. TaxID=1914230 RepID=UPI002DDD6C21|nr:dihydroxyacetone kinase family protein [Aliidongia sp.]HEV2677348.1 dihydroxyacetone kinase family protein [Aliidongia sp.]